MQEIKVEIRVDGELIAEKILDSIEEIFEEEISFTVENEASYESSEVAFNDGGFDFTAEGGNRYWITTHNTPRGYCEECGQKLLEGIQDYPTYRGEVWDKRFSDVPVAIPTYRFCSILCREKFVDQTMEARYGQGSPYRLEVEANFEPYNVFARILINGVEVYTLVGDDVMLEHYPNELPRLRLALPFKDYSLKGSILGPKNL